MSASMLEKTTYLWYRNRSPTIFQNGAKTVDTKVQSAEDEIRSIAKRHGIVFQRSALDEHCEAITRLSDDDVQMDDVENLIIAIGRANVCDDIKLTDLHYRYLTELKTSRVNAA